MLPKKRVVGIFSREHPDLYQWLVPLLLMISVVKDVRQVIITNNFFEFQEEVFKCSFAILYHSKRRGRLNVTDVTDSLYDKELQHLNETYGRKRVLVVIDDLEDSSDNVKNEILSSQQSIKKLAEELFLFSTTEKVLLGDKMASGYQNQSDLKNKLDRMKSIIGGKGHQIFSPESRSSIWPGETAIDMPDSRGPGGPGPLGPRRPGQRCSPKCIILIGLVIVVLLLVIVLPITLHH